MDNNAGAVRGSSTRIFIVRNDALSALSQDGVEHLERQAGLEPACDGIRSAVPDPSRPLALIGGAGGT